MSRAAVARSNADLATDELLGFLEFHSVTDLRIHKDDLALIFDNNGLDRKKFLPEKIHAHDAFRRATKEAEGSIHLDFNGKSRKGKLMVREVKSDDQTVVRHLVREIVNDKDEKLDYNEVGKIVLAKKSELVTTSLFHGFDSEYDYGIVLNTISHLYTDFMQYHNRETVANITRRVINAMNHVSIMPNGKATFLPRTQRTTLDALVGMFEELTPYHSSKDKVSVIEVIPVIDTVEQREMIARRAETDIQNAANELLVDFSDILSNEKVSLRAVKGCAERVVALQMKLEEYEDIVHQKMDVLQQQLANALGRMKQTQRQLSK